MQITLSPKAQELLYLVQNWRYRVGDYRLICKIIDEDALIIVVDINHRSRIYKDF